MRTATRHAASAARALPSRAGLLLVWVAIGLVPGCHHGAGHHAATPRLALPGAAPFSPALAARMRVASRALGTKFRPPSTHLDPDGAPKYTNRLIFESSPYLLEHAHNPVNWYPWGKKALATARRLGRPILLSIGYASCHWCHVMEEESFDNVDIARYLNENYVAIKVDREQRPDLDAEFMSAVESIGGAGGWPLTVWLTPAGKPYYGGSYFPPRAGMRGARVGFIELLRRLKQAYDRDPATVRENAAVVVAALRRRAHGRPGKAPPGAEVLRRAAAYYRDHVDYAFGGLRGDGAKFPSQFPVRFLFRYTRRSGDVDGRRLAVLTLRKMAAGGIRDHLGGGFHRYSVDPDWRVPHFEKMLYSNALRVLEYLDGYQATGDRDFAAVARETLAFLARRMRTPDGAFIAAIDADSVDSVGDLEEGAYYTWTGDEIRAAVAPDDAPLALAYYGVGGPGELDGRSVLWTPRPLAAVAREQHLSAGAARDALRRIVSALYHARLQRPPPRRDDDVITGWNGLAIAAFARAALVLAHAPPAAGNLAPADLGLAGGAAAVDYAAVAARAAAFLLSKLRSGDGLVRSYRAGVARGDGELQDYAFAIAGLLDLFEASGEARWLDGAVALDRVVARDFAAPDGGYYRTGVHHARLLVRSESREDDALPSGNSVMAMDLLRLGVFTGDARYQKRADALLAAFAPELERHPSALPYMLLALDFRLDVPKEIVLVAPASRAQVAPFVRALAARFVPNRALAVTTAGGVRALAAHCPIVAGKVAEGGKPTAYVCEGTHCHLPTTDPGVFAKEIAVVTPLAPGRGKPAEPADKPAARDRR